MKQLLALLLACLMLTGCGSTTVAEVTVATTEAAVQPLSLEAPSADSQAAADYVSRFTQEVTIVLSDSGITVNDGEETDTVYTSHDIVYYEDRDVYDSGNPYGEGDDWEKHTAEEAQSHTVVNITAPGAYRVSGKLPAGQIRVDLGSNAYDDPDARVELILDNADITCTVAPAILFRNTYECDGNWSVDKAAASVDTANAGANLILEGENSVTGSHVAKIFRDKEGEKKLWKQDGAIYSYMSMNVFGPGALLLTADNEGMDTELHLTIHGGTIRIDSGNDGINTNEDGVSVTTINGGKIWINAGLGAEGDGIDSNGYLVINGGMVCSSAKPMADAGLDSDLGSYIHGGTVIALGSTMDWAESESGQVTMNLQFAQRQEAGAQLVVTDQQGNVVFAYKPEYTEGLTRGYQGVILSSPNLKQGQPYHVYTGGTLEGDLSAEQLVDVTKVTGYTGGTQMAYTGSDVGFGRPGGMPGGFNGQPPEGFDGQMPEDFDGQFPGGFDGQMPEGFDGQLPEDFDPSSFAPPEGGGFPGGARPEGGRNPGGQRPEGNWEGQEPPAMPEGEMPQFGFGGRDGQTQEPNTEFYMNDMVNAFSGLTAV